MRYIAPVAAIVVVLFVGGTWYLTRGDATDDPFDPCRSSAVAGGAGQIGGPFELVTPAGETVTDADVITEPSIVYFGYTFCPDICPVDVARNAASVDILAAQGRSVTPVFITIDPERDTPQIVADYAANMHPKMIGLTGSAAQIKQASQAYRTYYKAHDDGSDYYLVDHSTFSYLVLPQHGFVEFFRREVSPDEMAQQIACFIDRS